MIGQLISELSLCNLRIWHTATQLKDEKGKLRRDSELSAAEKIEIHTATRQQNSKRSKLRFEIDRILDPETAVQDTKVNYLEE